MSRRSWTILPLPTWFPYLWVMRWAYSWGRSLRRRLMNSRCIRSRKGYSSSLCGWCPCAPCIQAYAPRQEPLYLILQIVERWSARDHLSISLIVYPCNYFTIWAFRCGRQELKGEVQLQCSIPRSLRSTLRNVLPDMLRQVQRYRACWRLLQI